MIGLKLILVVVAIVLFALAAFWSPGGGRFNLVAGGLAFWAASDLAP